MQKTDDKRANMSGVAVIIVAAGRGTRAGGGLPKQWRDLGGAPVLKRTLRAFDGVGRIVLVLHPDDMLRGLELTGGSATLVAGGATRDESVRNALESLAGSDITRVLIHDGARPFVSRALTGRVLAALDQAPAAAPALAVTDALWRGAAERVTGVQSREGLYRAQTPQGFHFPAILEAHRAQPGGSADDVEVARAAGLDVTIVEGEENNIKLTFAEDFRRGLEIMGGGMDVRMGNGYDVHAFTEGDHVMPMSSCGLS